MRFRSTSNSPRGSGETPARTRREVRADNDTAMTPQEATVFREGLPGEASFPSGIIIGDGSEPPEAPAVTLTPGFGVIRAEWDALEGLQSVSAEGAYEAQLDTVATFDATPLSHRTSSTQTAWEGLASSTTYYVRVRAIQGADNAGAWSDVKSATTTVVGLNDLVEDSSLVGRVDALPTLPDPAYPAGSVVWLSTDGKLYRGDGTTWTSEVSAGDVTGTIDPDNMPIITGNMIADFAVTAKKFNTTNHVLY